MGHVSIATLNRPQVLNALDSILRADLLSWLGTCANDDEIRVLVITGAGRGFCSGADVSTEAIGTDVATQADLLDDLEGAGSRALAFDAVDKPIVAAINGVAAGSGMSLALSCDLRVGDAKARFRTAFSERALSPDSAMSYHLPRILGYSRAADLIMTSRDVNAEEAYRLGLLDRLTDERSALDEALDVAARIASLPPIAIRASKRVLKRNATAAIYDALANETMALDRAKRAEADRAEAVASFRERRPGVYLGR
ncbi:hypothetical protein A5761_01710 [Mycolicibacterium setense]|uniref:enoyl-CoA hydratase/isomerase family protein n=1 Tax=Mycolicibacterium setense TaxID=431269 RepID=UPI0007EB07B5|nr:enoyl-CoA hydratase/isomerase family protein [Mycolicibacterium setense]OBB14641.1 hypothetical protein A5761_01710 [Mycolicibacterium setense]